MTDEDRQIMALGRRLLETIEELAVLDEARDAAIREQWQIIEALRKGIPMTPVAPAEKAVGRADVTQAVRGVRESDGSGTQRLNPLADTLTSLAVVVPCPADSGGECKELMRHLHRADGSVQPVAVP